jgi:hypothetical protein
MSAFDGNEGEMERFHDDKILEEPGTPLGDFVAQLRTPATVDESTASKHIAAAMDAVRLDPAHNRVSRRNRWRRRTVFGSVLTAIVTKVLAASVALAAVTGGVGVVANSAAPGDPLYGVDTFMERIGLMNGGTQERIEEAERLVNRNRVSEGLELAGEAIGALRNGYAPAAVALEQAAVQAQTRTQTSQQYRDDVTEMLRVMVRQMEQQQLNQLTETAEQVRETTREMLNQPDSKEDVTTTTCAGCDQAPSTTCAGCGDQGPGSGDGHNGGDDTGGGSDNSGGDNSGGNGGGGH